MAEMWRTGRHNGRVIYRQPGLGPDRATDVMIGVMDTPELAQRVCDAVNGGSSCERMVEFRPEVVLAPPFGDWHPIGGGLEVGVMPFDVLGTLRVRLLDAARGGQPEATP